LPAQKCADREERNQSDRDAARQALLLSQRLIGSCRRGTRLRGQSGARAYANSSNKPAREGHGSDTAPPIPPARTRWPRRPPVPRAATRCSKTAEKDAFPLERVFFRGH
jgi:hypothetical protein